MSKLLRFQMVDENGDDHEIHLPAMMVVCPDCDGHGTHVNPAIDGNGIGASEFHEDPDFAEAYFSGQYDVRCEVCKGLRVIPEVDRKLAEISYADDFKLFLECEKAMAEARRFDRESYLERMAERRFGA